MSPLSAGFPVFSHDELLRLVAQDAALKLPNASHRHIAYSELLTIISPEAARVLQRYIELGVIGEQQIGPVLQKALKLSRQSGPHAIRVGRNKLFVVLKVLYDLNLKETDTKAYQETFNRLMSKNGHETLNELVSHFVLDKLFSSYQPLPFYAEGADGKVAFDSTIVYVEIKSRFPQLYDMLEFLLNKIQQTVILLSDDFDWSQPLVKTMRFQRKTFSCYPRP